MGKPKFSAFLYQILAIVVVTTILSFCLQRNACFALSSSSHPLARQRCDERLPGQEFNVNFAHYAGSVTVNEEAGNAMFYWFFEVASNSETKPILLWLNGGLDVHPLLLERQKKLAPFALSRLARPFFRILTLGIELPTFFSYSNTSSDIRSNGNKRTAKESLEFLLTLFERFPQYKGRDFYVDGVSYAVTWLAKPGKIFLH